MLIKQAIFDFEHTCIRLHESFVAYYVNSLCDTLSIDSYRISRASFYHDHGKYMWEKSLLVKKSNLLTEKDWKVIKQHPADSVEIIFRIMPDRRQEFIKGDPSIYDLIYMHHEKPDGNGYYGIKDIPIESAILSICDIFDACLSDRTYRKHLTFEESIKYALQNYGQFMEEKGYPLEIIKKTLKKSAIQFTFDKVCES